MGNQSLGRNSGRLWKKIKEVQHTVLLLLLKKSAYSRFKSNRKRLTQKAIF